MRYDGLRKPAAWSVAAALLRMGSVRLQPRSFVDIVAA